MFDVMKNIEMFLENFSTRYRNSPFFRTDVASFDRDDEKKQNNNSNESAEAMCDIEE